MSMETRPLRRDEVDWIGYTFADGNMRTFRYKNKYFKVVQENREAWASRVLKADLLERLCQLGLIPRTVPCGLRCEGFGMVFAQDTEAFNVPMTHWSCGTLMEAARVFLALNKELLHRSLRCLDGHGYNFIIQGPSRPLWCDLGSFVPLKGINENADLDQFVKCFVYPLLLRQRSPYLDDFMRWSCAAGITHEQAMALMGAHVSTSHPRPLMLDLLREVLDSIKFQWKRSLWSEYHQDSMESDDVDDITLRPDGYNRNQMVARLLRALRPATVVDLGANAGMFARMAAQTGAEVLAIEPDETAVVRHLRYLREKGVSSRVKLLVGGVDGGVPIQPGKLALALALTHHLFFTANYRWKLIANCLAKHTSNALLTEFMPHGLQGTTIPDNLPPDYRLDLFLAELERHFLRVEVIDYPTPATCAPRTMILCLDKRPQPVDDGKGALP